MKTTVLLISLISFLFVTNKSFSQGEAAVPFLLLQPSPSLAAMGQTGTALPTDDPFGFIWNPAQLGYTSQNNNFSFLFYPAKTEWLPSFNLDLELTGSAFNLGYNLKDIIDFPLSVGFGYSNFEIDFGEFAISDSNGNIIGVSRSKDSYNAYSLGVGIDYYIQFNAGFSFKSVTSILSDRPTAQEQGSGTAKPNVVDFGLLLNIPVLDIIDANMQWKNEYGMILKPDFNFSIGYSKSNIGDEVYYIDPAQADPLPRMDRIGYGISTGFDLLGDAFQMKIINFSLTVEADDILITGKVSEANGIYTYDWEYSSSLSDLKPWKNLINIEGTKNIVSHIGLKFDLFETVSLSTGHFSGRGFMDVAETGGYELRAKGLFKLWALWSKDPITDFLRDHIDIRYYNTDYFDGDWRETKMTGLALYVHNLDSLF